MPLVKSKSKKAFKKNVEAEIKAGKPPKQAVAIAYAVKRKASKKKKWRSFVSRAYYVSRWYARDALSWRLRRS